MIKIENMSFCYLSREQATLNNINLKIRAGEMVLIAGRTGCGKSTLLKVINGLIPSASQGEFRGNTYIDGINSRTICVHELSKYVGTVYQNPDDQLFAMTVFDEVSFALENQGLPTNVIRERVLTVLSQVGLTGLQERGIHELSGGQRQRLALASVLVSQPRILVLDEPASQLNPQAVSELMQLLCELNRTQGTTIIVVEHRVHELAQYFSRIVLMQSGQIVYDGLLAELWSYLEDRQYLGVRVPQYVELARCLSLPNYSLNRELLAQTICQYCETLDNTAVTPPFSKHGEPILQATNLSYTYRRQQQQALLNVSFTAHRGETIAIMGSNGSGKSTLLNLLSGLNEVQTGSVTINSQTVNKARNQIGFLRQEPDLMLLCGSIAEEINWGNKHIDQRLTERIVSKLGLSNFLQEYPLAMSKGQRLRIVLASLLVKKPQLLLLDEPTTGQDEQSLREVSRILRIYKKLGGCIIFCTHDVELAAELADRVLIMQSGKIIASGSPAEILSNQALVEDNGLQLPPLVELCTQLGIKPQIDIKGVLHYVKSSALGR